MSAPYNPWRVSIENVISGDNFLRTSEYYELIAYIDGLLGEIEALRAHKCPTALDHFIADVEASGPQGAAS